MSSVPSKLVGNHFASVNDAILGQDSTYATYSDGERVFASVLALPGGLLKSLHGVGLLVGGLGVALVPGMELSFRTRHQRNHGSERSKIKSICPSFSFRSPFTRKATYELPGNRIGVVEQSGISGHIRVGFYNKTQHKPCSIPLNTNYVDVSGFQIMWTGLGVAIEGLVETAGSIPMTVYLTGRLIAK